MLIKDPFRRHVIYLLAILILGAVVVKMIFGTDLTNYAVVTTLVMYCIGMTYFFYKEGKEHQKG